MNLQPDPQIPSETVSDYAYRVLRKNILQAALEPGECISPIEVADILHISRTPIHNAYSRLMSDGLLNIYPQRGSYVSCIDMKRVHESVFMRNLLDQAAIRQLCSAGISDEGLIALESNLRQQNFYFMQDQPMEVFELDNAFHKLIYDLCGMEYTYRALQSISADHHRVRILKLYAHLRWTQTMDEHADMIRAIQSQDVAAGLRLSYEHVSRVAWDLESVHQAYPAYFENWEAYPPQQLGYRMEQYYNMYEDKLEGALQNESSQSD